MALNDFAAYGKPHSGSVIFAAAMQPLERFENKFGKLRVKPDAVVFYKNLTHPLSVQLPINLDVRRLAASEFQSVANQVLEKPQHLTFISFNGRYVFDLDLTTCFLDRSSKTSAASRAILTRSIFLNGSGLVATLEKSSKSLNSCRIRFAELTTRSR